MKIFSSNDVRFNQTRDRFLSRFVITFLDLDSGPVGQILESVTERHIFSLHYEGDYVAALSTGTEATPTA